MAAKEFAERWTGRGDEKQESQRFWIDLLHTVLGAKNAENCIEFEKPVKLTHTSFIDAYIAETKVLIEQKGADIDLHKAYKQSDGAVLSPYQQAKRYMGEMKASEKPRWIVVCNFTEFLIYDLEAPNGEPQQIFLKDLHKEYYRLQFLVDQKNENIHREEELSVAAGKLVNKLYDALYKEFIPPADAVKSEGNPLGLSESQLRSLNILCVRTVFCLYAEDAGLFTKRTDFEDYIKSFVVENVRKGLIELFKALDTPTESRDKYDTKLAPFPYVNGGLFKDEDIEIPNFTQEIVDVIVNDCAPFNWSEISPTIFGAVFESTLNPETRRKGGMHYTSIQNIHKVIDPLFMDDLNVEFGQITRINAAKSRNDKLLAFQEKLGHLTFLDPACGSGNFLTESYLSLRRLENEAIKLRYGGQNLMGVFENPVKVNISQFYGIEINDFAVTVAKTALWIAESQMIAETEAIISQNIEFLPLKTGANIVEGNALRLDWATLAEEEGTGFFFADKLNVYKIDGHHGEIEIRSPAAETPDGPPEGKHFKELNVIAKEVEEKELPQKQPVPVVYDYIIGNPPFVGARWMDMKSEEKRQKQDVLITFGKDWNGVGDLDYVCCWFKKASEFIRGTNTHCAFVASNSITQGGAVANLWKPLFEQSGIHIDFAWRTFRWSNETADKKNMAAVHCVIVGFSAVANNKEKTIHLNDSEKITTTNINGYLLAAPNICIEKRLHPISDVPQICLGGQAIDDGNLTLSEDEKEQLIKKEPQVEKFIRPYMMGKDFINRKPRYCLWLIGVSSNIMRKCPEIVQRVENVKEFRLASDRASTLRAAQTPALFAAPFEAQSDYIAIPKVSSENRQYIPMDYLSKNVIPGDKLFVMQDASLYHFGILTSNVHMAWMRAVCGRLKSDYSYSNTIVYNNFPWCTPTEAQKRKIEATAQAILDARVHHPDDSLADLYDETFMPADLRAAHRENDKAVMAAYGFELNMTESECVAELFKMYEKLTKR